MVYFLQFWELGVVLDVLFKLVNDFSFVYFVLHKFWIDQKSIDQPHQKAILKVYVMSAACYNKMLFSKNTDPEENGTDQSSDYFNLETRVHNSKRDA